VPGDDVVVDADLERLTQLAKAARIEFGKVPSCMWNPHRWQETIFYNQIVSANLKRRLRSKGVSV
jgi:hypothetical protein